MDSVSLGCSRRKFPKIKQKWSLLINGQNPVPRFIINNPNITAGAAIWTERKLIDIVWGSFVNSKETSEWIWVANFNDGSFRLIRNSDPLITLNRVTELNIFVANGHSAFRKKSGSDHGSNNPWLPWIGVEWRLNNRERGFFVSSSGSFNSTAAGSKKDWRYIESATICNDVTISVSDRLSSGWRKVEG